MWSNYNNQYTRNINGVKYTILPAIEEGKYNLYFASGHGTHKLIQADVKLKTAKDFAVKHERGMNTDFEGYTNGISIDLRYAKTILVKYHGKLIGIISNYYDFYTVDNLTTIRRAKTAYQAMGMFL